MVKKITCFFICTVILFFSACSQTPNKDNETVEASDDLKIQDFLIPYQLTHAEETLLDLVCSGDNVNIYDFEVNQDIKSVTIWCEEYENGKLINKSLNRSVGISKKGRIAITIDNQEIHMNVQGNSNKGRSTTYATSGNIDYTDISLRKQTKIEPNSELALMVYAASQVDSDEIKPLQNPSLYPTFPRFITREVPRLRLYKCLPVSL